MFGWPNYYLPFLVRAGHLKPLGKPAQNARKWFATVEIERMSCDPDWLDKAVRIVEKQIQGEQKTTGQEQSNLIVQYATGITEPVLSDRSKSSAFRPAERIKISGHAFGGGASGWPQTPIGKTG